MDRREVLKKLAIGGVAVAGGTGLLAAPAISKPPADRGGGKPGPDPTPTSGPTPTPTPAPAPGDPIGVPLNPGPYTTGPFAFVEFLTYKGGKGAKARLRVKDGGGLYHGWQPGGTNYTMRYESMSLDYVNEAVLVAGDATHPPYLDVKAGFASRPYDGSFQFFYWHGNDDTPSVGTPGVYTDATYYFVTVVVANGDVTSFTGEKLAGPPTSSDLINIQMP